MYLILKRTTDILVSVVLILLVSPLMILLSIAIKLDSKGPIFYRGVRAGKNGGTFRIMKFRSMVMDAEKRGGVSTALNDSRLTRVGRFIRKYKLDETPQFFNVLVGDMSLVGPRPQVLYYTNLYAGDELLILKVRPGITDLASLYFSDMDKILGDGDVDAKYKMNIEPIKNKLRIKYVQNQSYFLDLRIMVETFFKLLGINNVTGLRITPSQE